MIKKRDTNIDWFDEDSWLSAAPDDGEAAFWDEFWAQEEKADEVDSGVNMVIDDGKGGEVVLEGVRVMGGIITKID